MRARGWSSVVVAAALVTGCGGSSSSPASGPSTGPSDDPSSRPSTPSYVVASLEAGAKPCAVEGGFGSVWVSVSGDDVVLRIDPQTHKVLARIKTDFAPCGIAVGAGSIWVENYGGASVSRIDPATNEAEEIDVGEAPYDVTYADGAAWTTDHGDNTATRIDGRTGKTRTIEVGADPVGVAPGRGAVWVTNQTDGTLSRIDTRTLRVRTREVGVQPSWTAWGGGALWVAERNGMVRLDAVTGRVAGRVALPGQPNDGDIADGTVWVADQDGRLDALSAATGERQGSWPLGLGNPFVVAAYADLLWVVDFAGTEVLAIDPARLPSA
jgi:streptogramin lyase